MMTNRRFELAICGLRAHHPEPLDEFAICDLTSVLVQHSRQYKRLHINQCNLEVLLLFLYRLEQGLLRSILCC